MYHCCCYSDL